MIIIWILIYQRRIFENPFSIEKHIKSKGMKMIS